MLETGTDVVPARPEFHSLVDLLRERAEGMPDQLAYQFLVDGRHEGARITYGGLNRQAQAIGARLRSVAQRGDRALLMYPPGTGFLPAFFGCLYAGVIAIPLPPPDTTRMKRALPRLAAVVQDAQASLALTTGEIQTALQDHFERTSEFQQIRWLDTGSSQGDTAWRDSDVETASGAAIQSTRMFHVGPAPDDVAFLQYTSGSTSAPKGVIVSHANVISQCRSLAAASDYSTDSVTATWMPYFHDYGLIEGLLLPLFVGIPC